MVCKASLRRYAHKYVEQSLKAWQFVMSSYGDVMLALRFVVIILRNCCEVQTGMLTYICKLYGNNFTRQAGSDGSMSVSDSADPGCDPRRGSKFSFENFQPWG